MSSHTYGAPPSEPIDPESHGSVLASLPEYITQLVLGKPIHPDWNPLSQHLRQCQNCRKEFDLLYQQMAATYSETSQVVAFTPTLPPFLSDRRHQSSSAIAPPQANNHRPPAYEIRFSAAILTRMQVRIHARAGEMRLRYAYTFSPLKTNDPTVTVEVLSADDLSSRGVVRICVEFADRDPFEQAGTQVTLQTSEMKHKVVTDKSGVVIIGDVLLRNMDNWQISVVPPEHHQQL